MSERCYNSDITDRSLLAALILKNSTLPPEIHQINEARKYGYRKDGKLAYECGEAPNGADCFLPKERLGCPYTEYAGKAVDCMFKTCPGKILTSDYVPELFKLFRTTSEIPLYFLWKSANIIYECGEIEYMYQLDIKNEAYADILDKDPE